MAKKPAAKSAAKKSPAKKPAAAKKKAAGKKPAVRKKAAVAAPEEPEEDEAPAPKKKKVGKKKVGSRVRARPSEPEVEAQVDAEASPRSGSLASPLPEPEPDPPAPAPAPPARRKASLASRIVAEPAFEPAPARRPAPVAPTPRPAAAATPSFSYAALAVGRGASPRPAPAPPPPPPRPKRGGAPAPSALPSFLPGRIARVARELFQVQRVHPEQARAIEALLTGRDAMAVLPTGYGKSLIYQVCSQLLDRPVLVVSPLIALMRDQEDKLRSRNLPVVRLDSTLKAGERREGLARVAQGGRLVVLTTPETLLAKDARPAFEKARPQLLAVDEAHCISEWGHDFRPAYLQLAATRQALGIPQVVALTATATPQVREDIASRLSLKDPEVVLAPPHRENLRLGVHVVAGASAKLEVAGRILRRLPRPGILYCATTRAVDEIHSALSHTKIPCAKYHGGMADDERAASQELFMRKGSRIVMIATSAFGMGIDKPDIRYIVHFQVPGSLEQYVQEAGRAGRDGKTSDCILLFSKKDLEIQEFLESLGRPNGGQIKRVAAALSAWSQEDEEGAPFAELALAAGVPAGVARAACTEMAELGLAEVDGKKALTRIPEKELKKASDELAIRFDVLAMQDKKRLDAITRYAESDECRSAFIRRWFGEERPPLCGKCDSCRIEARVEALEEAELTGEAPPPPELMDVTATPVREARQQRTRRRPVGKRGRGRRGRGARA